MCVSVLLGAMQLAAGQTSSLYLYVFTNRDSAVGFFANANHMASLLLVTIPFQAALLQEGLERKGAGRAAVIGGVIASLAVTATGIVVVGSLAGYGLVLPIALASALIVKGSRRMRITAALLLPLVLLAGLGFILATHEGRAMLDQAGHISVRSRHEIFATTWIAIKHFWPAGTGVGTFAEVYRSFENPFDVTPTFINHAHDDYLELVLETGAVGLVLLVAFLGWWVVRAWRIWRGGSLSPYAMAAVIASGSLMAHSLVDYPLRTAALSSVFAACLALMAAPRVRSRSLEREAIYGADAPAHEAARTAGRSRKRRRSR
jgi:O-antigen ligase